MSGLSSEDEERELRMELMRADIELKKAQTRWEPWQVMTAAVAASAALFGATGGLIGYLLAVASRH